MNVLYGGLRLVKMLFSIQVHEIEFINQAKPFKKFERSIDRRSIDLVILFLCERKQGRRIKMTLSLLDDFEQNPSLSGDADAPQREFLKQ